MKSISILIPTLDSGGAEKQAVLLATQLSKYYEIHFIVLSGGHSEYGKNVELLVNSNVKVHKLIGSLISRFFQIKRILNGTKVEVLFNYLTLPDILGAFWGRRTKIRVYNGIRNSVLPRKKMVLERYVHNHWATGTVFNCHSGEDKFVSLGFNKSKCIVIPNCFPNIQSQNTRKENKTKTIITVGRFDPQKDYETLIKSVALLNRDDFRLCIVGYGVLEEQIRAWVKEYGIESRTEIHIKPDNVPELEANADIYLSTSLFEGTSNSIMEALNFSLPVVATNVGDNSYLVRDGVNGYLHNVGDAAGIASSLSKLLDSVDLRNEMGAKGNQNLRENYSMEIFEKRYLDLIEGTSK